MTTVRRAWRVPLAVVTAIVLGMTATGYVLTRDAAEADRQAWDPAVDFEAPLPFAAEDLGGLAGATVVREPGDGDFRLRAEGRDASVFEPTPGGLPEGVSLFTSGEVSLVLSERLYDGWPTLDPSPAPGYTRSRTMARIDNTGSEPASVYAWVIDQAVDPAWVRDVYWLLPSAGVTSSGDPVLNEVIELGDEQVPVMIVEPTGRWAVRWRDSMRRLFTVGDPDGVLVQGNLALTVLPSDARSARFTLRGQTYDRDRRLVSRTRVVEPTLRSVGDYQLAWVRIDADEWVQPTSPHAAPEPRAVATWSSAGQP